jgi:hypothetical protein
MGFAEPLTWRRCSSARRASRAHSDILLARRRHILSLLVSLVPLLVHRRLLFSP